MSTRQVELKDFAKVLEDFTHKHIGEIRAGVVSGIAKSIPDIVHASPVDTGLYAQSWDFTSDEEKAIIGNYAPHAPIIEYGARPFTPPIKPLLEWAKRVLQDGSQPSASQSATGVAPSFHTGYSAAVKSLAYATQKKIASVGIAPRHVLTKMLPRIIENIREELKNG